MEQVQVPFHDSTDEDASHVATVAVLPSSARESLPPYSATVRVLTAPVSEHRRSGPGRLARVAHACAGAMAWLMTGGGRPALSHEPFAVEQVASSSSSSTSSSSSSTSSTSQQGHDPWRQATLRHAHSRHSGSRSSNDNTTTAATSSAPSSAVPSSATSAPPSSPSSSSSSRASTSVEEHTVDFDLRDTILQYVRTGLEFYYNIILVTLKYNTRPITSDIFSAAKGNARVIKTLLTFSSVDENDPVVAMIVQEEVNRILCGNVHDGQYVAADEADYLRCLCQVKSTSLNARQVSLLRHSGFEFVKLLAECPHLLATLPVSSLCLVLVCRAARVMRFLVNWLGFCASLLFMAATLWTTIFWFAQGEVRNNGYWTILCYVGSYVLMVIWSFRVEEGKIDAYDDCHWPYPSNKLKLIPVLPVYELVLVTTLLRYLCLHDAARYLVIRHDLRNGISLQRVIFGVFCATPQIVVQMYLFLRGNHNLVVTLPTCFWVLIGSGAVCFYVAAFSFLCIVLTSHSCNTFGFAFMTSCAPAHTLVHRVQPTHLVTYLLLFFLTCFCIAISVALLIVLLNTIDCTGRQLTFIAVYVVVVFFSIVALVYVLLYVAPARWVGVLAVPVLVMEVVRYIATSANAFTVLKSDRCLLMDDIAMPWTIPLFVTFGLLCTAFVLWVAFVGVELVLRRHIRGQYIDTTLSRIIRV